jgi:hypothetical protein
MAIIQTRASASTLTTLRKRVRKMLGDTGTTSAKQRWVDNMVDQALVDQMFEMYNLLGCDSSNFLLSTTMTYTSGELEDDLPAAVQSVPIHRIMDITSGTTDPTELVQVDSLGIDGHKEGSGVWSRFGLKIKLRPIPSGDRTLRIEYLGNPFTMFTYDADGNPLAAVATTDQHPYPVAHEELLCLGAAVRLQEEDDEIPASRPIRLRELKDNFAIYAKFFRGRKFVRSSRKWS